MDGTWDGGGGQAYWGRWLGYKLSGCWDDIRIGLRRRNAGCTSLDFVLRSPSCRSCCSRGY